MPDPDTLEQLYLREHLDDPTRSLICLMAALSRYDLEGFALLTKEAIRRGLPEASLRECCLQGVAYAGFPRALAALFAIADQLGTPPTEATLLDRENTAVQGVEYFRGVYAGHADRLLDKIRALAPDFAELVLSFAYGSVLSRPGLSPMQRELMGVGSLAVLGQTPQLLSHAAGALRFGATIEACLESVHSVEFLYPDTRLSGGHDEIIAFLSKIQARGV